MFSPVGLVHKEVKQVKVAPSGQPIRPDQQQRGIVGGDGVTDSVANASAFSATNYATVARNPGN